MESPFLGILLGFKVLSHAAVAQFPWKKFPLLAEHRMKEVHCHVFATFDVLTVFFHGFGTPAFLPRVFHVLACC